MTVKMKEENTASRAKRSGLCRDVELSELAPEGDGACLRATQMQPDAENGRSDQAGSDVASELRQKLVDWGGR